MNKTLLERAFELARAGRPLSEIIRQLGREGYSSAASELDGRSVRRELKRLRHEALLARNRTSVELDDA